MRQPDSSSDIKEKFPKFITEDPATIAILREAADLAVSDLDVMILGESGVGKEVLGRGMHRQSERAKGPFVAINLAAIPETMVESEVFGYEKGAFTGAGNRHLGRFEQANQGILFLDEIGHLPASLQSKLLRTLQEKSFYRLGGEKLVKADVRVLAATDVDLVELAKSGVFEKSLYFRFQAVIKIPPLRERPADIPVLTQYYLEISNYKYSKAIYSISSHALKYLQKYAWPGNVRQLMNTIEWAVVRADPVEQQLQIDGIKPLLEAWEELPEDLLRGRGWSQLDRLVLDDLLKLVIQRRLQLYKGNKKKAAESLRIGRGTFRTWCKKYGLESEE